MDLISVIVPVYKVELYLRRCVDSILNQTYNKLEIILVDDGSPDNCGKICDEYECRDSRVIVIHKKNGGLSDARNVGLDNASGSYIVFVDSDDYIDKTMIEVLYNDMIKNNSDISVCDFVFFNENQKKYNSYSEGCLVADVSKYDQLFNEYRLVTTVQWNKLFKKNIFDNLRFPKGKINEDEFIICSELEKAKRVSYNLKPLYFYYQRLDSIMGKMNMKRFDAIDALENQVLFFQKKNMKNEIMHSKIHKFSSCNCLLSRAITGGIDKDVIQRYTKDNQKLCKEILKKYGPDIKFMKKIRMYFYLFFPNIYYFFVSFRY